MKRVVNSAVRIIVALGAVLTLIWLYIAQPTISQNFPSQSTLDEQRLQAHVEKLSREFHPRSHAYLDNLDKAAGYIRDHFENAGATVEIQEFSAAGKVYKNIIGIFGKGKPRKLIIGAHYDAYEETPGADDNASGVAGLIELAYLLGKNEIEREVELVAYCLEEPPYFSSTLMGSYVHANKIKEERGRVEGVIVFEMIGYFSDEWGSQSYPIPLLYLIYPNRGNFIAVVGLLDQRSFVKSVKVSMKGTSNLPVYSINAPESLTGIDYSDHRNYWSLGINAVMITDTAFYRYKEYHGEGDTSEKLNYNAMAKVVIAVYEVITNVKDTGD